jgi:G:T-mismatch repair DNA endonuclease (very short patch repair protein)
MMQEANKQPKKESRYWIEAEERRVARDAGRAISALTASSTYRIS